MEIISGIELYNKYFDQYGISVPLSQFYGVEISDLLRTASLYINELDNSSVFSSVESLYKYLIDSNSAMSIHDLGVGSYAFTDSKIYADFLNLFSSGSIKLFHKSGSDTIVDAGSKSMCIYSLEELKTYLNKDLVYLSSEVNLSARQYTDNDGYKSEISHFILGDSNRVMAKIDELRSINSVNKWFSDSNFSPCLA